MVLYCLCCINRLFWFNNLIFWHLFWKENLSISLIFTANNKTTKTTEIYSSLLSMSRWIAFHQQTWSITATINQYFMPLCKTTRKTLHQQMSACKFFPIFTMINQSDITKPSTNILCNRHNNNMWDIAGHSVLSVIYNINNNNNYLYHTPYIWFLHTTKSILMQSNYHNAHRLKTYYFTVQLSYFTQKAQCS